MRLICESDVHNQPIRFDGPAGSPCPDCQDESRVSEVALVHLLVRDATGPVTGFQSKTRWRILCGSKDRDAIKTGEPSVANCDDCLKAFNARQRGDQ